MAKTTKKAITKKATTKKTTSKTSNKTTAAKKTAAKKNANKPKTKPPVPVHAPTGLAINNVKIRMYCIGTGDCFVLKFCHNDSVEFTMMIDCGSCQGKPSEVKPYVDHLAKYVENNIDLLVVTHEHQDHVNGFAKCETVFKDKNFKIEEAWFAWTENPEDPTGAAAELQRKRSKMKLALSHAYNAMSANTRALKKRPANDYYAKMSFNNNQVFLNGLESLTEINLPATGAAGNSLPGMEKIKNILEHKNTKIKYLNPGETVLVSKAKGIKFHVLGPPMEREFIFKDGKEGVDVYKKKLSLNESSLAAHSFLNMGEVAVSDLPFALRFTVQDKTNVDTDTGDMIKRYNDRDAAWRKIDDDWLNSAGSLALRLNSHINNTSLALAIEFEETKDVLLFPGDAEYGSWESWHEIKKWKPKKENEKHFVEDLLNRTIFYKVGHHLSYNGTALQKGIIMMEKEGLVAMATLDRRRISKGWKSTMPNKLLKQELIKRCQGKFFIMDEFEIDDAPSKTLDPATLDKSEYETETLPGSDRPYFIQYTCKV